MTLVRSPGRATIPSIVSSSMSTTSFSRLYVRTVFETIANILRANYDAVTYKLGAQHDFLIIHWDFSTPGLANLTMEGYISDIISKFKVIHKCNTPATDRLFLTTDNSPLLSTDQRAHFHSCVMTLYYLAKRVHPQILTAISYLASRVSNPTAEDQKKLDRVLS
jgi:hypothetical protein